MDIAGWWSAFGITFAVVELACLVVERATRIALRDLDKAAMKLAYVRVAPRLGGGLAVGRAVLMARALPIMALVGLATAFLSTIALTIFPKYRSLPADADLYHALNAPFYVGLGAAYVAVFVLLASYLLARPLARAEPPGNP